MQQLYKDILENENHLLVKPFHRNRLDTKQQPEGGHVWNLVLGQLETRDTAGKILAD